MVLKPPILARFIEQYKSFWVQNGDNISKFYAGTRALDGKSKVNINPSVTLVDECHDSALFKIIPIFVGASLCKLHQVQ